jgi:hypothetical protein
LIFHHCRKKWHFLLFSCKNDHFSSFFVLLHAFSLADLTFCRNDIWVVAFCSII